MKKTSKVENEKFCAALSYFLIGIIWYFADEKMKKSNFAKYHAKQGIVLLIAWIIYDVVIGILIVPLVILSLGLLAPILMLLYYLPLIWAVIGVINSLNEKTMPLPLIGKMAEKLNF